MNETMIMWACGVGAPVIVAAVLKLIPKAKLIAWVTPACNGVGVALSRIMALRFGRKAAETIEEGIFATLAATIYAAVDAFMKGLLYDNEDRNSAK